MSITFEFACQDDCLDQMLPGDLRRLVAERDRLAADYETLRGEVLNWKARAEFSYAERDKLAAENKELRDALEKFDALIKYQYNGSREAMSELTVAAKQARAALAKGEGK